MDDLRKTNPPVNWPKRGAALAVVIAVILYGTFRWMSMK